MKWYKLVFKQNQPFHIGSAKWVGSAKWGVINETEIFIPGWTMWGALTNQFLKTNGFNKIDESKKIFEKITNFYPAIGQVDKDSPEPQPLFPQYKGGVLSLGDYSEEEFKFEFVDTIVSTAVEPVLRSAKDESLHEFEYILPKSKIDLDNKAKQLYWVGLIGFEDQEIKKINVLIKNNINNQNSENENRENEKYEVSELLKQIFSKVYIGGDSKYGFGEMELVDPINEVTTEEEFNQCNITEDGKANIQPNYSLRQFLKFANIIKFEGEIKLLAEFDFTQNIPRVQKAGCFINVGSKVSDFNGIDLNKYHLTKGKFEKIK
jgi:hypothetical protein